LWEGVGAGNLCRDLVEGRHRTTSQRRFPPAVWIVPTALVALAVVLFLAAFFCWSIWGAVYALLGRMVREAELGTAFGLSNSISFVGAIVGPTATGWVRDLSGSFSASCVFAAVLALAGVALVVALRAPERTAAEPASNQ